MRRAGAEIRVQEHREMCAMAGYPPKSAVSSRCVHATDAELAVLFFCPAHPRCSLSAISEWWKMTDLKCVTKLSCKRAKQCTSRAECAHGIQWRISCCFIAWRWPETVQHAAIMRPSCAGCVLILPSDVLGSKRATNDYSKRNHNSWSRGLELPRLLDLEIRMLL